MYAAQLGVHGGHRPEHHNVSTRQSLMCSFQGGEIVASKVYRGFNDKTINVTKQSRKMVLKEAWFCLSEDVEVHACLASSCHSQNPDTTDNTATECAHLSGCPVHVLSNCTVQSNSSKIFHRLSNACRKVVRFVINLSYKALIQIDAQTDKTFIKDDVTR